MIDFNGMLIHLGLFCVLKFRESCALYIYILEAKDLFMLWMHCIPHIFSMTNDFVKYKINYS